MNPSTYAVRTTHPCELSPEGVRHIADLIISLFSKDELSAWLGRNFERDVIAQIDMDDSHAVSAFNVVTTLGRHGCIDERFWRALAAARPRRHAEIAEVRGLCFTGKAEDCDHLVVPARLRDPLLAHVKLEIRQLANYRAAEFISMSLFYCATSGLLIEPAPFLYVGAVGMFGLTVYLAHARRAVSERIVPRLARTKLSHHVLHDIATNSEREEYHHLGRYRVFEKITLVGILLHISRGVLVTYAASDLRRGCVDLLEVAAAIALLVATLAFFHRAKEYLYDSCDVLVEQEAAYREKKILQQLGKRSGVVAAAFAVAALSLYAERSTNLNFEAHIAFETSSRPDYVRSQTQAPTGAPNDDGHHTERTDDDSTDKPPPEEGRLQESTTKTRAARTRRPPARRGDSPRGVNPTSGSSWLTRRQADGSKRLPATVRAELLRCLRARHNRVAVEDLTIEFVARRETSSGFLFAPIGGSETARSLVLSGPSSDALIRSTFPTLEKQGHIECGREHVYREG